MARTSFLTARIGLRRTSVLVLFMLINAFLWYYLTLNIIAIISKDFNIEQAILLSFHASGVIIGGLTGLLFSKNRYKILLLWTLLGAITPLIPLLISISTLLQFQLLCLAWGFSLGLGMPSCLSYFMENITIENRGRLSGIIFLVSFSCAIPIVGLVHSFGLVVLYSFFGFWRLLGFIPLLILQNKHRKLEFEKDSVYTVPRMHNKVLFLYLVPWFMFNIVDNFEGLLLRDFMNTTFPEYYSLLQLMYLLFLGLFAFLGGFLCDLIGRKPVTILGFTTIGIAYAVISVIPRSLLAWFLFSACYGSSWGFFYTIFITLIWGDLAPKGLGEKYYFVGNSPLFLAIITQMYFANYITHLSETNAFSLAAILLFLAVIPILFVPETLPEKKIKERELKKYIEKAKKVKEKYG